MLDAVSMSMNGLAGAESTTENARNSLNQTYDQFLKLLTTQLKNQDPLNPMDTKDMTNQLISLAEVEQSIAQTDKLNELIKLNQTSAINSTLLSYVGMEVDYKGDAFTYKGGVGIQFDYSVAANAANAKVNIYDEDNTLVYSKDADFEEGDHSFVWSGVDNEGKRVPNGKYHLEVVAKDASDNPVTASSQTGEFSYSNTAAEMPLKYNLEKDSKETIVSIFNTEDELIWSGPGATTAGDHVIAWPGTDKDGKPVPIGSYRIAVGAKDIEDRAVKTTTIVPAVVGGIEAVDGGVQLIIGNQKVPIDTVTSVRIPS
jgi:flagellar basal-body rod modification protein FlgD